MNPAIVKVAPLMANFEPWLSSAMALVGITSGLRQAHFLAQLAHESGGFRYVREIWGPTKGQVGYEGRVDLGNSFPGDGHKFRGGGLIQTTGRNNFLALSHRLFKNDCLICHPEMIELPQNAALSAAYFWQDNKLNDWADKDNVVAVSGLINTGSPHRDPARINGLAERKAWLAKFKKELVA